MPLLGNFQIFSTMVDYINKFTLNTPEGRIKMAKSTAAMTGTKRTPESAPISVSTDASRPFF